jgi:methylphosphotriester-DNA--protein-cysteine methyltransferase
MKRKVLTVLSVAIMALIVVTHAAAATQIVYITKSGTKYHNRNCRYLTTSQEPLALAKAQEQGYKPCKRCH